MEVNKLKKGESVITTPIILLVSIAILVIMTVYCINMIMPFIWYQKMQLIATKYMYVIDKYGYLTTKEMNLMKQELKESGFDVNMLNITAPLQKKEYGKLIELKIEYQLKQKIILLDDAIMTKQIPLIVRKYSYSKV